jgi:hypothetical protein
MRFRCGSELTKPSKSGAATIWQASCANSNRHVRMLEVAAPLQPSCTELLRILGLHATMLDIRSGLRLDRTVSLVVSAA